jgi:hypothetical protein
MVETGVRTVSELLGTSKSELPNKATQIAEALISDLGKIHGELYVAGLARFASVPRFSGARTTTADRTTQCPGGKAFGPLCYAILPNQTHYFGSYLAISYLRHLRLAMGGYLTLDTRVRTNDEDLSIVIWSRRRSPLGPGNTAPCSPPYTLCLCRNFQSRLSVGLRAWGSI